MARLQMADLPHPAAILLGLGVGWQWTGLRRMMGSILDPSSGTITMVAAVVLLAASIGPRVPGRFVLAIASRISARWRGGGDGDGDDAFWMLRAIRDRDESLLWLSFAALTSTAGVLALLTLAATALFARVHALLMDRFFWTELTLSLLEWLSVALLVGSVWVVNGMVVAALAPVAGARFDIRRSPPGIVAGLLIGLGVAWLLHETWGPRGVSGRQEWLLGVLPMLGLSIIAAAWSKRSELPGQAMSSPEQEAPELTTHAEGWIWLSLVVWGCGTMLGLQGWFRCRAVDVAASWPGAGSLGLGALLLGVGMALASWHARHRKRSASGCGMALWAAGAGMGLAASLTAVWPGDTGIGLLQIMIFALPAGYALHYTERAWLARAGSETLGFAHLTTALLAGCAISLIAGQWWVLPSLGPMGAMSAGTLAMLAFGGLVQIYEEESPAHTQRLRLAVVFASLSAAIVLLPANARLWGRQAQAGHAATCAPAVLPIILQDHAIRTVCLIGDVPVHFLEEAAQPSPRIDWIPLRSERFLITRTPPQGGAPRQMGTNGFRTLRLLRGRYDLLYQTCPPVNWSPGHPAYAGEWLSLLAEQTAPGGQVILEVPLARLTPRTIQVLAVTFEQALNSAGQWQLAASGPQPALLLRGFPGRSPGTDTSSSASWHPLNDLLAAASPPPRVHSLQRDRLSVTLTRGGADADTGLVAWLLSKL